MARAKIASATCQPRFSLPIVKLRTPENRIAKIAARVENFLTPLKTSLAPFTGLVYEPT
jgi:hypothetical protein